MHSLREAKSGPSFADRSSWFCAESYSRIFYFKFWAGQRTPNLVRIWRHFRSKNRNIFDKTPSVYNCDKLHFSCIFTVFLSLCQGIHPQFLCCPSPVLLCTCISGTSKLAHVVHKYLTTFSEGFPLEAHALSSLHISACGINGAKRNQCKTKNSLRKFVLSFSC